MLIATLYLFILPIFIGSVFGNCKRPAELYLKGNTFLFALFTLCYYIELFLIRNNSLILLIKMFLFVMIPFILLGGWKTHQIRLNLMNSVQESLIYIKQHRLLITLMLIIIGFHALRLAIGEPSQYRDSCVYDPLVTSIADSEFIYVPWGTTTFEPTHLTMIHQKYITTPWYVYEAALSKISGLHPLIITKTLIPVYILLLSYMAIYLLSKELLHDANKTVLALILCSLLYESRLILGEQAAYLLIWPSWGKTYASLITCTIIAAWFVRLTSENHEKSEFLWFLLFTFAGTGTTAATIMVIPIEICALTLANLLINKSIRHSITIASIGLVPCILQFSIYWMYTHRLLDSWLIGAYL